MPRTSGGTSQRVLHLIETLYSCADDQLPWTAFLDGLNALLNARVTTISIHALDGRTHGIDSYVGADEGAAEEYAKYYARLNPWFGPTRRFAEGQVVLGSAVLSLSDMRRTEFYNDWGKKNQVVNGIGGSLMVSGNTMCFFAANRGEKDKEFEERELRLAQRFVPHLRRVLELRSRLAIGTARERLFDGLTYPLLLIRSNREIRWANAAARDLLAKKIGLTSQSGRLEAMSSMDNQDLGRLLSSQSSVPGGWLKIYTPLHDSALLLFVSRVSETDVRQYSVRAADDFWVFINSQSPRERSLHARLCSVWGLTAAEATLAIELLTSESLLEAAAKLNISPNTAKTQLAAVFQKSNTRRQTALVREISGLALFDTVSS